MKIEITLLSEPPRTFELEGHIGWTMAQLANAGAQGVATIENPAPRWSAYVYSLRKLEIQIETEMEPNYSHYPGQYTRYRLVCGVNVNALCT